MIKFDPTGKYLAVGDHAGRVVTFETVDGKKKGESYDYATEVTIFSSLVPIPCSRI